MPYSEGWHPYYSLGEKVDNLKMTLPASRLALLDKADLPTGNFQDDTRFVGGRTIGDEFINDCFCLGEEFSSGAAQTQAHILLEGTAGTLDIWQQAGVEQYNAIQIYTPPTRASIAIEPMTSEPDALNHHFYLFWVKKGALHEF